MRAPGFGALFGGAALFLLLLTATAAPQAATLRVAVAANFKPTLEGLNRAFEAETGHRILLSSASTGTLSTQISAGAPFDLFFAADQASVTRLEAAGLTGSARSVCYAVGRLVLAGGDDLGQLANPGLSLAIANPAVAPYGRAATQVLARPEFAGGAARKLVRGSSVAQAYQFWHSGSTDLGLLPASLAAGIDVPEAWHAPIEQYAVTLPRRASETAAAEYLDWIRGEQAQALIIAAGYRPCS